MNCPLLQKSATDIGNFDPTFTRERAQDNDYSAPVDAHDDAKFKGFDYTEDNEDKRTSKEITKP